MAPAHMMHGSTVTCGRRTPLQVFAAEGRRRGREGLHLGMGRRIGERFDKVVATAHHRTVGYNYRTDRHLLFI